MELPFRCCLFFLFLLFLSDQQAFGQIPDSLLSSREQCNAFNTVTETNGNVTCYVQKGSALPVTTASAGPDDSICQGTPSYTITGTSATNYINLWWTTTGLGILSNSNSLNPVYYPPSNETGSITMTLTAAGAGPGSIVTDQRILSIIPAPMVSAGIDDSICMGETFSPVTAYASFYSGLHWVTGGNGIFDDPRSITPIYTPGFTDIRNGRVVLSLIADGFTPCNSPADSMTLFIFRPPVTDAGPDGEICEGLPYTITGSEVLHPGTIVWTHTGAGTLDGENLLSPTYTPAPGETGMITLTLHSTNRCGSSSDYTLLTIYALPTVSAGNDTLSCNLSPVKPGASATTNAADLLWTTSGSGNFDNPELLHPLYYPGIDDVQAGQVILSLSAKGFANCGTVTDQMVLSLNPLPIVSAGPDGITCQGMPFQIKDAVVSGADSVAWIHNSSGTLEEANTLTPTYRPSESESGSITLILTGTGAEGCGNISDTMNLLIRKAPEVSCGNDLSACGTSPVNLPEAQYQNCCSVRWTTAGGGTFNDPTKLNPEYLPGENDPEAGTVILTLHGAGLTPCGDVADELLLTFAKSPVADAGTDASICEGETYTLSDVRLENGTPVWNIIPGNSGTLTGTETLTPLFMPAPGFSGNVIVKLTAKGSEVCDNVLISDEMHLTVNEALKGYAGNDQEITEGNKASLQGSVSNGSGIYAWSWQPDSLLENSEVKDPVTIPLDDPATFTLTVMDLSTGCTGIDEVTVMIRRNVTGELTAHADYDTTVVDIPLRIDVLANDIYPEGRLPENSLCSMPANGKASVNDDLSITYEPDPSSFGDDSLCYRICIPEMPEICSENQIYIHIAASGAGDLVIPSGITPNGDHINDNWIIQGIEEYPDNSVVIFNRWGDKIIEYSRYDNSEQVWSGRNSRNQRVSDGTYFYILDIKDLGKRTGWIFVRDNH